MTDTDKPKIEDLPEEVAFWKSYRETCRAKKIDAVKGFMDLAEEQKQELTSPGAREDFIELCEAGCLQLVLAGIGLKKSLRLVLGDKPVYDDLVIQSVAITEMHVAIEDEGRTLAACMRERLARYAAEKLVGRARGARVGCQQQRPPVLVQRRRGFQGEQRGGPMVSMRLGRGQ